MTILREDVWKAACTKPCSLDTPGLPVVVANGETLDLLGQTTVSLQVAGVKANYTCLVTSELTQECIIGADFLLENQCIIDSHNPALLAGGQTTQFLVQGSTRSSLSVCRIFFPETTVLPGNSEVQLPLSLSTTTDQGMAILEPAPMFIEKHGVLIAHSLTLTGDQKTLVRVLNPSPAPVVIHQNKKVGKLVPLDQPDSVCTLDHLSLEQKPQKPKPSDVE